MFSDNFKKGYLFEMALFKIYLLSKDFGLVSNAKGLFYVI